VFAIHQIGQPRLVYHPFMRCVFCDDDAIPENMVRPLMLLYILDYAIYRKVLSKAPIEKRDRCRTKVQTRLRAMVPRSHAALIEVRREIIASAIDSLLQALSEEAINLKEARSDAHQLRAMLTLKRQFPHDALLNVMGYSLNLESKLWREKLSTTKTKAYIIPRHPSFEKSYGEEHEVPLARAYRNAIWLHKQHLGEVGSVLVVLKRLAERLEWRVYEDGLDQILRLATLMLVAPTFSVGLDLCHGSFEPLERPKQTKHGSRCRFVMGKLGIGD